MFDLFPYPLALDSAVTLAMKQSMNSYVSLVLLVLLSGLFVNLAVLPENWYFPVFPLFVLTFSFLKRRSVCSILFASSVRA